VSEHALGVADEVAARAELVRHLVKVASAVEEDHGFLAFVLSASHVAAGTRMSGNAVESAGATLGEPPKDDPAEFFFLVKCHGVYWVKAELLKS
jgi:hypothetical protein